LNVQGNVFSYKASRRRHGRAVCVSGRHRAALPEQKPPRPLPRVDSRGAAHGNDAVYNDCGLAEHLRTLLEGTLGENNVVIVLPITASEDFSVYIAQGIPRFYFSLGGAAPEKFTDQKQLGRCSPLIIRHCLCQMWIVRCEPVSPRKLRSCTIS